MRRLTRALRISGQERLQKPVRFNLETFHSTSRRFLMRIALATVSSLLFACSVSMAQTPVQQVTPENANVRQLNTDIRNNEADVRKDSADARHDQADIDRDRLARSVDQKREDQDLARGDVKGAQYWNKQRVNENGAQSARRQERQVAAVEGHRRSS
jgi:hypothetical protein